MLVVQVGGAGDFALTRYTGSSSPATFPFTNGNLGDTHYTTIGTKQNSNSGFGSSIDIQNIKYYADPVFKMLFMGIEGKLNTVSNDGIGLWLNFDEATGLSSGTSLGGDSRFTLYGKHRE